MIELLIPMLMNINTLHQIVNCCIVADVSVKRNAAALMFKQSQKTEGS